MTIPIALAVPKRPGPMQDPLMVAARKLEATFLAEMLKAAGFGQARSIFGGGAGEDQFASFMVQKHAEQLAAGGGIGLREQIFHGMNRMKND